MDHFVVCYDGSPLVVIKNTEFRMPSDVLAWYAKAYSFDRSKLTWRAVPEVACPKVFQPGDLE